MHFLQRMVAKAVSEALTQAMNRKLQKQTDELVQENEDSTGGAYHFLVSGYYRGLQMKIFSVPMIIALLICLAGMTLSGQTDVVLESIMAVLIVYCLKDAGTDLRGVALPQFLAVGVVAVTYKWKHQTLFSIAAGTLVYMILLANL